MTSEHVLVKMDEYPIDRRRMAWRAIFVKPDGSNHCHFVPPAAIAARSIEKEVPLDAADLLWDLIVHEPHMPMPDDDLSLKPYAAGDPAVPHGLVAPNVGLNPWRPWDELIGVNCHRAATLADGRAADLLRYERCLHENVAVLDPKGIRTPALRYRHDKDWIAWYRDEFARVRENVQAQVREALRGR